MNTIALNIETTMNRYQDGFDSADIFVVDAGRHGKMVSIGVVPEGIERVRDFGGQRVPGPWAYSYGHAVVVDGTNAGMIARENAIQLVLGQEFTIDNAPGVYTFDAGHADSDSPVLREVTA
jgi:hypothetical protein